MREECDNSSNKLWQSLDKYVSLGRDEQCNVPTLIRKLQNLALA